MTQLTKLTFALAATAALAGATAANLWNMQREPPAAGRRDAALEAKLAQLQQEVAALRGSARARHEDGRGTEALAGPPEESPPSSDAATREGAAEQAGQQAASSEQMRDLLDIRFSAEAEDRAWSSDALDRARAVVANQLRAPSRLLSLECKSTLCRAQIEQPDEAAHRVYLEQFLTEPWLWEGTLMASLVEQAGSLSTVLFLARSQTELLADEDLYQPL